LRRAVAVSFEGEDVRIVYATLKRTGIEVDDALIVKDEQFDHFLEEERAKEFIVVSSFKGFFQDTVLIPPTKKRFIKRLIEAEVKKRSQFKDFSFLYTISGEKIVEHRRIKEVSVFAVKKEDMKDIVDRFVLRGKVIKAIYPDIFSIACLIGSEPVPFLCISETGLNKNMFLIKDGVIQFIRIAQSAEKGIRDIDIQNINMTVNYCRQNLKINPYAVALAGSVCSDYNVTTGTSIPIACLSHRMSLTRNDSLYLDFISPLSAFFVPKDRDINLLPGEYKNLFQTRLFLKYSTALFMMLSLIGMGYTGYIAKNIVELKSKLNSIRASLPDVNNTLTIYDTKKAELAGYMPFITSFRNATSIPDIQKFLSLLSELKTDTIRIDHTSITAGDNILNVELKGSVKTEGYANMQMHYQKLIDSISGIKGASIKGHRLEFRDKSFRVEITYQ